MIRDSILAIAPRWLKGPIGEKFLYSFGLALDGVLQGLNYGLRGRFPGAGVESAMPLVGDDRNLPRYPHETDAMYASRLNRAWDDAKTYGFARGIIREIEGFCYPFTPRVRIVATHAVTSNSSTWHLLAEGIGASGTVSKVVVSPLNWTWDSFSTRWWRIWVIIYPDPAQWRSSRKWGDGSKWGDGGCWGINIQADQAQSIRDIVKRWKPANVTCVSIIYSLNSTMFDYTKPSGDASLPDATWEHYSKLSGGKRVRARSALGRYQDGV